MRAVVLALVILAQQGAQNCACAGDITVYSPGIVNKPLTQLAQAWAAETGNKVTLAGFNVGRIRTAVAGDAPGDVVIAPASDFTGFAPKLVPGSQRALGRVPFGLVVKAGGPHPDISSHAKFVAAIRQAGVMGFANPQVGSLTGGMVDDMLKRPEFAGVERRPVKGLIGEAIARGDAPFGGGAITEEINVAGAEVVGPFPDDFGLHVDVSAAVLKTSANASDAEEFLRYATRPEAQPVWKAGGIMATPK